MSIIKESLKNFQVNLNRGESDGIIPVKPPKEEGIERCANQAEIRGKTDMSAGIRVGKETGHFVRTMLIDLNDCGMLYTANSVPRRPSAAGCKNRLAR